MGMVFILIHWLGAMISLVIASTKKEHADSHTLVSFPKLALIRMYTGSIGSLECLLYLFRKQLNSRSHFYIVAIRDITEHKYHSLTLIWTILSHSELSGGLTTRAHTDISRNIRERRSASISLGMQGPRFVIMTRISHIGQTTAPLCSAAPRST